MTLRKELPAADITFINRTRTYMPRRFVTDVLAARDTEQEHELYLAALCEKHSIRFREDNLKRIDAHERLLELDSGERLVVDYLVVDLPYEPHSADIPGAEFAYPLSGMASANAIRKHLASELKEARNTNKASHRSTIVVGAGITGVEAVCATRELANELCEKNYLFPYEIEHILIDGHAVDDTIPANVKKRLKSILEGHNIEWYDKEPVRFTSESVALGDRELETNTIIWTATPKGNRLFKESGLPVDERGFLITDEHLAATPWLFGVGHSTRASGKTVLGNRVSDALIEEGYSAAQNIVLHTHHKPLVQYAPRADTVRTLAIDKRHGLLWIGPFTFYGRCANRLRAWHEGRVARKAQKA